MKSVRNSLLAVWVVIFHNAASNTSSICELVKPSRSHCSIRGRVDSAYNGVPNFIQPVFVSSEEDCATLCNRRMVNETLNQVNQRDICLGRNLGVGTGDDDGCDYCGSFEYNIHSGLCQLWGLDITKHIDEDPNGPYIYGAPNSGCYDCPPTGCEAPYGVNLLDNPGFESSLFGPWITQQGTFGPGHGSSQSFSCNYDPVVTCALKQPVNRCPRGLYLMRFNFKPLRPRMTFVFDCGEEFSPTGLTYKSFSNPNTSWQTFSAFCRIDPNNENIFSGTPFGFQDFFHRGSVLFDNLRFSRVYQPLTLEPGAKSLLINGGFEDGTLKPWKFPKSIPWKVVSPGINSQYAAKYSGNLEAVSLVQTVTTKVGYAYLLKLALEIASHEAGKVTLNVVFGPAEYGVSYIYGGLAKNRTFSIPHVAQHENTTIQILLEKDFGHKKYVLDNISFKELQGI